MMQNVREEMMACSPCSTPISDTPATPTTHHLHHSHLPSSPTVASSPPLTSQPPASTLTSLCNMNSEAGLPSSSEGGAATCTTNTLASAAPHHLTHQQVAAADKQAALTSKLRLAKGLGGSSGLPAPPPSFNSFRASLMEDSVTYNSLPFSSMNSKCSSTSGPKEMSVSRQSSDMDIASVGLGGGIRNYSEREELSDPLGVPPNVDTGDIHVMSPSLVSSQVLSKTRPLSPDNNEFSPEDCDRLRMHSQPINYQVHQYQKHQHGSGVFTKPFSGSRETLHPMGPSEPNRLDNGLQYGGQLGYPFTERASMERKSSQRNSWSRRKSTPSFTEDKDQLKGSVKERLSPADSTGPSESAEDKPTGTKSRSQRGRRRPRLFKLKFHHQALPPEYLDHYEASLRQEQKCPPPPPPPASTEQPSGKAKTRNSSGRSKTPRPITIHEAGNGATEALLRELLLTRPHLQQAALQQAALARAQSVPSIMMASKSGPRATLGSKTPSPVPSIVEEEGSTQEKDYSVSKSKRGRRNKKVDLSTAMGFVRDPSPRNPQIDMEASLSAQYAAMEHEAMSRSRSYTSLFRAVLADQNEPLNLCVRDTPVKLEDNACLTPQVKEEPPNTYNDLLRPPSANIRSPDVINHRSSGSRTPMSPPLEYGSWASQQPQWMHDYRLKTEDGLSSGQSTPSLCSQSSHLPPISPPAWPHFSPPPQMGSPHSPSPSPMTPPHRNVHALLKESLHLRLEEAARERLTPNDIYMPSPDRMSTPPQFPPTIRSPAVRGSVRKKRAQSYMPHPEPNTEVSICKFKFTGGPNPMLEEKKMVSVDAAGTMRCYSGGERSLSRDGRATSQMRLSGKFIGNINKNEKDNKKIRLESLEPHDGCSMSQPTSSACASPSSTQDFDDGCKDSRQLNQVEDSPKRKRRSKKASMREKFEQTLREKGLLIQTQQVQSAEGATYCKFRQLRKITRYLFRSWKDHFPGQVPEDGSLPDGVPRDNPEDLREIPQYHGESESQ